MRSADELSACREVESPLRSVVGATLYRDRLPIVINYVNRCLTADPIHEFTNVYKKASRCNAYLDYGFVFEENTRIIRPWIIGSEVLQPELHGRSFALEARKFSYLISHTVTISCEPATVVEAESILKCHGSLS